MPCDAMCGCESCVPKDIPKGWPYSVESWEEARELDDVVNSPSHYKVFPDMEAIHVIRSVLTHSEFVGYCKGNILKYRLRAGEKDGLEQEIGKADKYREWLGDCY